jgi:intracellular sulfur oxidation DsrE/DsrF family protein
LTIKVKAMKKCISIAFMMALLPSLVLAQGKPLRIIFDVTSKDTLIHQATIRHVSMEAAAHPDGLMEIVIYGGAINMVVKNKSVVASGVQQLTTNKNVSIKVCGETMKRYNIDKSQLMPGVEMVPDAIMEIVEKQGLGWGYIKEAH